MKSLDKTELNTVQGGGLLSFSIGLLAGAFAVRGYDMYKSKLFPVQKNEDQPDLSEDGDNIV